MAHLHSIYDCDTHFVIDLKTREIKNDIGKTVIVQNDHNSERFSFELPKEIEGHDMSRCNVVQVHYVNIDAKTKEQHEGSYEVEDLQVSPDDNDVVILSWLLSQNATRAVGNLYFGIVFKCIEKDGSLTYSWHTTVNKDFKVVESLENSDVILEEYPDILAQFEARFAALEEEYAEKLNEAVGLTESVNQLKDQASTKQETANALKANASGEIVRIDDVSPIEHKVKARVNGDGIDFSNVTLFRYGKNLFDVNVHKTNPQNCEVLDSTENKYTIKGNEGKGTALAYSAGAFQVRFNKNIKVFDKVTVSAYVTLLEIGQYDNRIRVSENNTSGVTIRQNDFELEINKRQKISVTYDATRGSINAVSFYLNNNKVLIEVDTLQVEVGDVATNYEPYTEESCKFSTDGTAEILSASPTMTLFTDTEGANIEIEYNRDINDAIEQLKKESPDDKPNINIDDVFEKISGSVNLYQPTTEGWIDNTYIRLSGETTASNNYCVSPKIPVTPNTTYSINSKNYGEYLCYDSNDNYIGYSSFLFESDYVYGTTRENTAYIRLNVPNSERESFNTRFMLVEGIGIVTSGYGFKAFIREIGDLSLLNVEDKYKKNLVTAINQIIQFSTLTEETKTEIATEAAGMIDIPLSTAIGSGVLE